MDFALTSANIADETFLSLKRTLLVSKSGSGYGEVRKVLTPRWAIVWRDLIIGWLTLIVVMLAVVKLSHRSQALAYIGAVFGAVMQGFTIAYITLFLHEAAHRNLHPDHQRNDLLCNLFVSGIIGVDVQTYREVHWEHHRQFGGPMDSENSYRDLSISGLLLRGCSAFDLLRLCCVEVQNVEAASARKRVRRLEFMCCSAD